MSKQGMGQAFASYVGVVVAVALLMWPGVRPAYSANVTIKTDGEHKTTSWEFDIGGLPVMAVKTWRGSVSACATADGASAPPPVKQGTKLTWNPPAPATPLGSFTNGMVTLHDSITGPRGSNAAGSSTCKGKAAFTFFGRLYGSGSGSFFADLAPSDKNGTATYSGDAWDPWAYGQDGFIPIEGDGQLELGLVLPADGNVLPSHPAGASWSVTYSAYVRDNIATYDDQEFFSGSRDAPELVYSLSLGASESGGLNVNFTAGTPFGFPLVFDQSKAAIESSVMSAVSNGWTGDLTAFTGRINLSGHTNATIGYHDSFFAAAAAVPEPASLMLLALGGTGVLRRRTS